MTTATIIIDEPDPGAPIEEIHSWLLRWDIEISTMERGPARTMAVDTRERVAKRLIERQLREGRYGQSDDVAEFRDEQ